MIFVNGEERPLMQSVTLAEILEELGYETTRVAVERNQEIIPRSQYDTVMVNDGDHLEVVRFVGGG